MKLYTKEDIWSKVEYSSPTSVCIPATYYSSRDVDEAFDCIHDEIQDLRDSFKTIVER